MLRWFVRKVVEYVLDELDARGRVFSALASRQEPPVQLPGGEDDRLSADTRMALAQSMVGSQSPEVRMSAIGETSRVEADKEHGDRTVDRLASL